MVRTAMTGFSTKSSMRHVSSLRLTAVSIVMIATNASVWAQDPEKGRIEFLSKCAECHGADGRGAGPTSSKLRSADLTLLAKRNNGVFSPDVIAATVDGRSGTKPHRSAEMPIWGCRQGPRPGPRRKAHEPKPIDSLLDMPCDPEEVIQKRILDIVEYLGRIQQK
jgi:hypothetical protein